MSRSLNDPHRRYVRNETIVSAILNTLVCLLFAWIVFHGNSVISLWGGMGLAVDMIPTCFAVTLFSTVAITLITRSRLRKRVIAGMDRAQGPGAWLPRALPLRAIAAALAVTVIAAPISIALLMALRFDQQTFASVLVFKAIYGAVLGYLISPPLVLRALAD